MALLHGTLLALHLQMGRSFSIMGGGSLLPGGRENKPLGCEMARTQRACKRDFQKGWFSFGVLLSWESASGGPLRCRANLLQRKACNQWTFHGTLFVLSQDGCACYLPAKACGLSLFTRMPESVRSRWKRSWVCRVVVLHHPRKEAEKCWHAQ